MPNAERVLFLTQACHTGDWSLRIDDGAVMKDVDSYLLQ